MGLLGNKNKFAKAKGRSAHPYGDPTFLSFFLMFDWYSPKSPLFNGDATNFLRNVIGDNNRADQLEKFKKYLKRINQEMPWFWQSITGLNAAYDYGKMDDALVFKEGAEIEIGCLETLDFTMAGIFNMYQSIVLDTERYVQVLPDNLCYFNVYVHVQEIRNFVPFIGSGSAVERAMAGIEKAKGAASSLAAFKAGDAADRKKLIEDNKDGVLGKIQDRLNSDQLDWKSKGLGPRFITKLGKCKFSYNNGMDMFSEISNAELGSPVQHKLKFKFHTSKVHEFEYLTGFNHVDPDPLSPFNNDILNDLANDAVNQLVTKGTAFARGKLEDFKNKLLLGNVYGANALSKIQDVFNSGSINAIVPLVKGEDPKGEPENVGRPIGDNVHPVLPADEVALESTKIYEDTPEEQPLTSTNTMPIASPEVPLESTRIYDDAPEEGTLNSTRIYDDAPPESPLENSNVYE